ncbi:aminopeptidase P family protein [Brevibacillus fluminis]|uniref:Aminopeptidase P family protein n=1 Tax=Brevibacillus fluminis TaxID=511487 RepID=A0A3M8DT60_9BACL|nr:Xaa-Pro peptidase family protein [Brevibacillus fluminis]RNB91370.1 aminopeptidase P family protein [Brevibacillus fluminis]
MNGRLQELYSFLESNELDAMVITQPKHIYYLTGFLNDPHERFMGLVLRKGEEPFLVVPLLDLERAQQGSSVTAIFAVSDTEDPYALLQEKLQAVSRLGLEEEHLNVIRYRAMMAALNAIESVDVTKPLHAMRTRKSPEEIVVMKRAIHLIEQALAAGVSHAKPGMSEIELVAELEYQMKKLGADSPAFNTIVLSGEKTSQPHGIPGSRQLQTGEFLLIDAGVLVDGYHSDITRTFAVGDIDEKLADQYDSVLQANLAAIASTRPSCTFASVDQAARSVIAERGYGEHFITRVGHGLGLELHEYPSVHGDNQDKVYEGLVFTIEPGIYIPQHAGVRIEDNVWVTKDGVEVLTSFPKELTIIGR